jgi:hypothetical protein
MKALILLFAAASRWLTPVRRISKQQRVPMLPIRRTNVCLYFAEADVEKMEHFIQAISVSLKSIGISSEPPVHATRCVHIIRTAARTQNTS